MEDLRERCLFGFPWAESVIQNWPPSPEVSLFVPPMDADITLKQLWMRIRERYRMESAKPLLPDEASQYDDTLQHIGRPMQASRYEYFGLHACKSLISAFYGLLFHAWTFHRWGRLDGGGFVFELETETQAALSPLRFHTRMKRTTSMLDLDSTAQANALEALALLRCLPTSTHYASRRNEEEV